MQASAAARLPFMMVMHSTSDVAGICIDGWSGGERRQDEQGNCTSSDVEQRGRKVGCPGWARSPHYLAQAGGPRARVRGSRKYLGAQNRSRNIFLLFAAAQGCRSGAVPSHVTTFGR